MTKYCILGIAALLFIAASTLLAEDFPFENPLAGKEASATFTKASNLKGSAEASRVQINDKSGAVILQQDLAKQDVRSARWTEDGKFLVITSLNSEGHSPWRFTVDVFSVDARELRLLSDETRPPCISSQIWCQAPDTLILVGHTFEHHIAAPDDPILLRYEMKKLWPELKKL
ncbi:MAG TPA: hypothetical protein VLK27_12905 [Chthoniobacterales bacterium]|nr:hypothetical protein [Chthoniobacterales bacterium]